MANRISADVMPDLWVSDLLPERELVVVQTSHHKAGFTLVEIMIVVAIIALIAAIAVPSFMRARKRSQATAVKNDLRLIDSAIAQYAIETNKQTGAAVYVQDWVEYIKSDANLATTAQDVFGNDYGDQVVDTLPHVPGATWDGLSDVVDGDFWAPFTREGSTPPASHKPGKKQPAN